MTMRENSTDLYRGKNSLCNEGVETVAASSWMSLMTDFNLKVGRNSVMKFESVVSLKYTSPHKFTYVTIFNT